MAKLTNREVAALAEKGRYHDGGGLHLSVGKKGNKAWVLRYWRNGKSRDMGLGRFRAGAEVRGLTLAEARMKAAEAHRLLRDGLDPIEERERNKNRRTSAPLFRELVDEFIVAHEPSWRNPKTGAQFKSSLKRHAFKIIGDLPVDSIEVEHIVKLLQPIQAKTPVMAERVRSQIGMVLDSAEARGFRSGPNPTAIRRLQHILPKPERVRKPKHHAAMAYAQVPAFMRELRKRETLAAKALQFTILTAARTAETIGARWAEIDLKAKLWTIPGARMKSGRDHRVPLTGRALALLASVPRENDNPYVFVGARRAKGMSNMAMLKLIGAMRPGVAVTVHGFRSTFRDWAAERTTAPREVAEAALAHATGDKTEAAYARSDVLEKRRKLMAEWARFCGD